MSDADTLTDGAVAPIDGDARVLLLVDRDENRALLAEWLSTDYEVLLPDDADGGFGLCIADAVGFREYGDRLEEWRTAAAPVFLPTLLVVSEGSRSFWQSHPTVWRRVDEVITTPVRKAEFDRRIEGLLDRRALSQELVQREAEFSTLFRTAPDPVVVLDAAGRVRNANGAFTTVSGREASEMIGEPLSSISPFSPDVEVRLSPRADPPLSESPFRASYTTDGGEARFVEINAALLPGADDDPGGTIAVFRDVTEQVRTRRELERQNERLDEFAGVLAHEIRNPLNVASGFLESAREDGDDDALERVERAHGRIERMVDELLALARQGELVGAFEPVPLAGAADDAWTAVVTPEATVEVETGGTVVADRDRLTEVLANLFRNAVEHASRDATVRVGWVEDGDGFYVEDDGPGIPEEERESVFDPGYTTDRGGTGFGLAIVRQIVDAHGWSIDVRESAEGGARFEIAGVAPPGRTD